MSSSERPSSAAALSRKRIQVHPDELHLSVAYQRTEPRTHDGRKTDCHPAALRNTGPFTTKDSAGVALGLGLADQLEYVTPPSRHICYPGESKTELKFARSRSLPTSQLDIVQTERPDDTSPENIDQLPSDISQTCHQSPKEGQSVQCQTSRYLYNVDREQTNSYPMSLLTAQGWTTAERPTTSTQIETAL